MRYFVCEVFEKKKKDIAKGKEKLSFQLSSILKINRVERLILFRSFEAKCFRGESVVSLGPVLFCFLSIRVTTRGQISVILSHRLQKQKPNRVRYVHWAELRSSLEIAPSSSPVYPLLSEYSPLRYLASLSLPFPLPPYSHPPLLSLFPLLPGCGVLLSH